MAKYETTKYTASAMHKNTRRPAAPRCGRDHMKPRDSASLVSLRLLEMALKLGWFLSLMSSIRTLSVVVR